MIALLDASFRRAVRTSVRPRKSLGLHAGARDHRARCGRGSNGRRCVGRSRRLARRRDRRGRARRRSRRAGRARCADQLCAHRARVRGRLHQRAERRRELRRMRHRLPHRNEVHQRSLRLRERRDSLRRAVRERRERSRELRLVRHGVPEHDGLRCGAMRNVVRLADDGLRRLVCRRVDEHRSLRHVPRRVRGCLERPGELRERYVRCRLQCGIPRVCRAMCERPRPQHLRAFVHAVPARADRWDHDVLGQRNVRRSMRGGFPSVQRRVRERHLAELVRHVVHAMRRGREHGGDVCIRSVRFDVPKRLRAMCWRLRVALDHHQLRRVRYRVSGGSDLQRRRVRGFDVVRDRAGLVRSALHESQYRPHQLRRVRNCVLGRFGVRRRQLHHAGDGRDHARRHGVGGRGVAGTVSARRGLRRARGETPRSTREPPLSRVAAPDPGGEVLPAGDGVGE